MAETNTPQSAVKGKPKVLVVDASAEVRKASVDVLKTEYQVAEAESAAQAWDILQKVEIQALFTAPELPDIKDYGLIEQVRDARSFKLRNLPIIVLADKDDGHAVASKTVGANEFFALPFDAKKILSSLRLLSYSVNTSKNSDASKHEDASMIDPLTGIPNRSYFFFRGPKDVSFAKRHNKDLSVILVQMDAVEELIEQYGRPVVKQLLKKLAKYIQIELRSEDTLARIGARRYAVIAANTNENGAKEIAQRILKTVRSKYYNYEDKRLTFSVSVGFVTPPPASLTDFDGLVNMANQRLDLAIWAGGDTLVYADQKPVAANKAEKETDADVGVGVDFAPDTGVHTGIGKAVDIVPEWEKDQQNEAGDEEAAEENEAELPDDETAPALEMAMRLLKEGQLDKLKPKLGKLLKEIMPLLDQTDNNMDQELKVALEKLRDKI